MVSPILGSVVALRSDLADKYAMRPVYMISGGITKFAKAHPDKDFRLMMKEAFDAALADLGRKLTPADIGRSGAFIESGAPRIGIKVRARFCRKKTWSVNDVYFVPAA